MRFTKLSEKWNHDIITKLNRHTEINAASQPLLSAFKVWLKYVQYLEALKMIHRKVFSLVKWAQAYASCDQKLTSSMVSSVAMC